MALGQNIDFPLYKYMEYTHAEMLMSKGLVRLGTLYDFRTSERKGIKDSAEGMKTRSKFFSEGDTISNETEWDNSMGFTKNSNLSYVRGRVVIEPGAKISVIENVPDAYIYCTSKAFDPNLFSESRYDSCIEIFDPVEFSRAVLRKLVSRNLVYDLAVSDTCKYIGRDVDHTVEATAHFLKHPDEYSYQQEYRFVFHPLVKKGSKVILPKIIREGNAIKSIELPNKNVDIKPFNLYCKEALKFCRWKLKPSSHEFPK